jgi:hypothetical protein
VRDREAERLFLTTSKTDQQTDFQSVGTDGYEVKKDFAGPSSFSIVGLASFLFISPPELGAEAHKAPMAAPHRTGGTGP